MRSLAASPRAAVPRDHTRRASWRKRGHAGTPVVGPPRWGGVRGECGGAGAGRSVACRPTAVPPWSPRHEPWPTAAPPRDAAVDEASRQRTVPLSRSIVFTVPSRHIYLNFCRHSKYSLRMCLTQMHTPQASSGAESARARSHLQEHLCPSTEAVTAVLHKGAPVNGTMARLPFWKQQLSRPSVQPSLL